MRPAIDGKAAAGGEGTGRPDSSDGGCTRKDCPGVLGAGLREGAHTATLDDIPPPQLSRIRPEDFLEVGRALRLLEQAVERGLMPDESEFSRLRWLAALERARTMPARNPAGIFLYLVRNRLWHYLTEAHITAASERLKRHLFHDGRLMPPFFVRRGALERANPERPEISTDALIVQVVRNELARRGERQDIFVALWTHAGFARERYKAALAEMKNAASPAKNATGNSDR